MFFAPAPRGFWCFPTLCASLKGTHVAVARFVHALEAWERSRGPAGDLMHLPGNGQLLIDTGDRGATLHVRVQMGVTMEQLPTADRLQRAHQLLGDFAAFIAPRLEWSPRLHAAEPVILSGTPRNEPGELLPEGQLQMDGFFKSWRHYPAVKFYRTDDGELLPLNTWAFVSESEFTEEQLCVHGCTRAAINDWRALVIDRPGPGGYSIEQGCYWQERTAQ